MLNLNITYKFGFVRNAHFHHPVIFRLFEILKTYIQVTSKRPSNDHQYTTKRTPEWPQRKTPRMNTKGHPKYHKTPPTLPPNDSHIAIKIHQLTHILRQMTPDNPRLTIKWPQIALNCPPKRPPTDSRSTPEGPINDLQGTPKGPHSDVQLGPQSTQKGRSMNPRMTHNMTPNLRTKDPTWSQISS